MQGQCKLCDKEALLKESHFIPKFVGKWVKKTSITGYIRINDEEHKRAQDIAKEYWLCGECELLFSDWERNFANNIFYPFVKDEKSEAFYDSWMSKFCASLTWRTLTYIRSKNDRSSKSDEYNKYLDDTEKHLRKYLRGEVLNLDGYEQHVFPLDAIESTTYQDLPPNINRYFLRTMAMDIVGNDKEIFIYTKLPKFIILGIVKATNPKVFRARRIAIKSGKINPREYRWPDGFHSYIINKANEVSESYDKIPEKHKDSFDEFIKKNPGKAAKSKLFEAIQYDHEMFGDKIHR
ncbi:MAG: hypothetical protein HRU20_01175 [Pseudomonadales bacterium]|nr:hypothetical protein [Pseudomonadales bacterium]